MYIFDWKFKRHPYNYIGQSLLAVVTIVLILILLNVEIQTALIASLGATVFSVFSMPHHFMCSTRTIAGGYIVGMAMGVFFDYLKTLLAGFVPLPYAVIITAGFAVGAAIFIMVITNTEHPPAAGIAMGLILNNWNANTLFFIIGAVVIILLVMRLLKSVMINLIGYEASPGRYGMKLKSPAFDEGDRIPVKFTAEGKGLFPPLVIEQVPGETRSLAFSLKDSKSFISRSRHWLIWNIPPDIGYIEEGSPPPGVKGTNDFETLDYIPPSPNYGTHTYVFKLYALDCELNLPQGAGINELKRAMQGHIIEKASLAFKYSRRQ